jgi:hypothetical protein
MSRDRIRIVFSTAGLDEQVKSSQNSLLRPSMTSGVDWLCPAAVLVSEAWWS